MTASIESIVDLQNQLRSVSELSPELRRSVLQALERLCELESNFSVHVEREKLAALKEFAYGASHEINNPLANISTRAQSLASEEKHPERRRKLVTIAAQAMRAHEMISDLMLFAKPPIPKMQNVMLSSLIATVLDEMQTPAADQQTVLIHRVVPPSLSISADPTQLAIAIKAIIRNALEALQEGGQVEVTAEQVMSAKHDSEICIAIRDNGPGISADTRKHLFDPFYSGREAGRGLGFGLAKCWRIVELHGGRIEVESTPGDGAAFSLLLPLQASQSTTPPNA